MKNTKEITTGAMLLAIFGAVLLIDRQFSFLFLDILVLLAPISIIIYGTKYGFKNGCIYSISLLLISFILSPSPTSVYYYTTGTIVGNVFNILLDKKANAFTIILITMLLFGLSELFNITVFSSILYGQSFYQIVSEYIAVIKESAGSFKDMIPPEVFNTIVNNFLNEKMVSTMVMVVCILTGVIEGFLVYVASLILFRRFKINVNLSFSQIIMIKPLTAYILFALSCLILVNRFYYNQILTPVITGVSMIAMFILAYYGYIYLLILTRVKLKRNLSFLFILIIFFLFPLSLLALFILGFLYGTGLLNKYLVVERKENE